MKTSIKEANVARTAGELEHGNRLVVPRLKTVAVHLDVPHQPDDLRDAYRLTGRDRGYDRTLKRADSVRLDDDRMLLLFKDVPPGDAYTLRHLMTAEIQVVVFADVPFADLPDYGSDGASPPEWKEPPKPGSWQPPKHKTEDALVHVDEADCVLDAERYPDYLAARGEKASEESRVA